MTITYLNLGVKRKFYRLKVTNKRDKKKENDVYN